MPPISDRDIARVAQASRLPVVVRELGTELTPVEGGSFTGVCPFCPPVGSSVLHVSPPADPNGGRYWWCSGCEESGNVINFVRLRRGSSFTEAVEFLAQRAGIRLARHAS